MSDMVGCDTHTSLLGSLLVTVVNRFIVQVPPWLMICDTMQTKIKIILLRRKRERKKLATARANLLNLYFVSFTILLDKLERLTVAIIYSIVRWCSTLRVPRKCTI
jgi:hypothetical protein